jgi:hypothetical protein
MSNDSVNDLAEGQKEVGPQQDLPRGVKNSETSGTNGHAKKRRDAGSTHVTRHGLLSKDIVRALVRRGENLRSVRRHEKKFRDFFKVRGPLMELFFDRWWSYILRLQLSGKLEARVLTSDHPNRPTPILPELQEGDTPCLVTTSDLNGFEIVRGFDSDLPQELFRELALVPRYHGHFAHEGDRLLVPLLLMRRGGEAALLKWMLDGIGFTKTRKG